MSARHAATAAVEGPVWRPVQRLSGWRRALTALSAGVLSVLAFAPWHLPVVLFATLPVLVWLIDGARSYRDAAIAGWWYGFGFFLLNLFWIGEAFLVEADKFAWMLPFAVTLLPAGLAFFWAGAAALAKRFWGVGFARVLVLATVLTATEWLRGHILTGLPWNVLGYALTWPVTWMQGAALVGVYALSLPAVLIFAAPLVMIADAGRLTAASLAKGVLAAALPLAALTAYGSWRLSLPSGADVEGVKLRLVQPSVPQREKWMGSKQAEIFALHRDLTVRGADGVRDGAAGITHVIWPEAAMPFLPLEHPEALRAIADSLPPETVLISGALRRENGPSGEQRGFNSIMAFTSEGGLAAVYDKVHLVPFGEYLPMQPVLSALGLTKLTHGLGAFDAGPWPRPRFEVPGLPQAGGLICYEVLFPGEVVEDAHRPALLVNVTNDGWFGDTSGPRQHFHQARVRAVEEGLPIVRVANNGISAVIDGLGRVRTSIDLNVRGVADSGLPSALPATPFGRMRHTAIVLTLLISLCLLLAARRRARR